MTKKLLGGVVGLGLMIGVVVFVYMMTNNKLSFGYNDGYQPDQPIAYSHQLHAGKLGIDCKYCHTTTAVSRHASIPPLNVCMNCHLVVRATKEQAGKNETSKEIAKVIEAYESGKGVQWNKVHLLPDFVKFNHAAHINAGKQCTECHGPIETMEIVKQYQTLSMGWCVNCHRKPENNASTNCGTCHY